MGEINKSIRNVMKCIKWLPSICFFLVTALALTGCCRNLDDTSTANCVFPTSSVLLPIMNSSAIITSSLPPMTNSAPPATSPIVVIVKTKRGVPTLMTTHPVEGFDNCYRCHLIGESAPIQIDASHSCDECHSPGPALRYYCHRCLFACIMCHAPNRDYTGPKPEEGQSSS
jgi:hypothetical protein